MKRELKTIKILPLKKKKIKTRATRRNKNKLRQNTYHGLS